MMAWDERNRNFLAAPGQVEHAYIPFDPDKRPVLTQSVHQKHVLLCTICSVEMARHS